MSGGISVGTFGEILANVQKKNKQNPAGVFGVKMKTNY